MTEDTTNTWDIEHINRTLLYASSLPASSHGLGFVSMHTSREER